ncbi:Prefoldin subunit 6 [Clonorchis sinensis]|uniref:Prefoldin subunit 6 n=2 Tax=Clonorchis sinensis TaxID=79923 RepID=A0A8T1MCZ5_CLOSI|nr:Prefoldin subunit 6 [Clonorchis sinensis]
MDAIYKRLNSEVEKVQNIQRELQKCLQAHRQLSAQLSENQNVAEDFTHLNQTNTIYKIVGPVLLKQDLDEAKETVKKRIGYITSELKRLDERIKDMEKQQDGCREQITKLQQRLQQEHTKAALKT